MRRERRNKVQVKGSKKLNRIYDRDRGICHLCGHKVDRALMGQNTAQSPSLDHIIPRSYGGLWLDENLKLAHVACNQKRMNNLLHELKDCPRCGLMKHQDPEEICPHCGWLETLVEGLA